MSHTSGNILLHLFSSTQGRRPLIKPEFRDDLFAYLGGIIREMQGAAVIVNGTADYVHMLVRIRPAQSAAENRARDQSQLLQMGSLEMELRVRLADRIGSV